MQFEKFSKLFETERFGQILIKLNENVDGVHAVSVIFQPENLGVCSFYLRFSGEKAAEKSAHAFDDLDVDIAISIVADVYARMNLAEIAPSVPVMEFPYSQ